MYAQVRFGTQSYHFDIVELKLYKAGVVLMEINYSPIKLGWRIVVFFLFKSLSEFGH